MMICNHNKKHRLEIKIGPGFDDKYFYCRNCGSIRDCKSHGKWEKPNIIKPYKESDYPNSFWDWFYEHGVDQKPKDLMAEIESLLMKPDVDELYEIYKEHEGLEDE